MPKIDVLCATCLEIKRNARDGLACKTRMPQNEGTLFGRASLVSEPLTSSAALTRVKATQSWVDQHSCSVLQVKNHYATCSHLRSSKVRLHLCMAEQPLCLVPPFRMDASA